jgi:hypothetical protein
MSGSITLPLNMVAHTPCLWTKNGIPVAAPTDVVTTTSNTSIAVSSLFGNMTDLSTIPYSIGTVIINVASASLSISDSITVIVTDIVSTADDVDANASATTFTPKLPG